ncbi:hypothetical protein L2E82_11489 [Cichorium intybus]|uniref:Uncharacterized protein n=1 Tax=Cichorium intybus TaxID=13427 RepID=A0ACB9GDG6_CICIN|nr:hypothetical protein L2E82_11489 [Cichorium intybus]
MDSGDVSNITNVKLLPFLFSQPLLYSLSRSHTVTVGPKPATTTTISNDVPSLPTAIDSVQSTPNYRFEHNKFDLSYWKPNFKRGFSNFTKLLAKTGCLLA